MLKQPALLRNKDASSSVVFSPSASTWLSSRLRIHGLMVGTHCGPQSKVSRKALVVQYNWNQWDALGKYAKFLERLDEALPGRSER